MATTAKEEAFCQSGSCWSLFTHPLPWPSQELCIFRDLLPLFLSQLYPFSLSYPSYEWSSMVLSFILRVANPYLANRITKAWAGSGYSLVALCHSAFKKDQSSIRAPGAVPCGSGNQTHNKDQGHAGESKLFNKYLWIENIFQGGVLVNSLSMKGTWFIMTCLCFSYGKRSPCFVSNAYR